MVACFSGLQTLAFDTESSWAESSTTFSYGVPIVGEIDISGITQPMLQSERVVSRRLQRFNGHPGPWAIQFSFRTYLNGHGSTTTGSTSLTDQVRLLGYALGGWDASPPSGTTFNGGGSAGAPGVNTASGFPAGGLLRAGGAAGALGTGLNQFYALSTHATSVMTLLTALPSTPNSNELVYSAELAYPADSSCSVTGTRFRIQTADLQLSVHGCYCSAISITGLNPGEIPMVEYTWVGSRAEPISVTFPTTPTPDDFRPSPNAADGSCFFNTTGTSTRATINVRQFSIDYQLGVVPVLGGYSGLSGYQVITGATRTPDTIMVSAVVDGQGPDTTPEFWDEWLSSSSGTSTTSKHLLYTLNGKVGQSVGIYFRNLCYAGNRPTQIATNSRNTIPLSFYAKGGTTTTSDLTLAPMVLGFA